MIVYREKNQFIILILSLSSSLTLKVLIYLVILGNIKTNVLIKSPGYPTEYFEFFFFSINNYIINVSIPNLHWFFAL